MEILTKKIIGSCVLLWLYLLITLADIRRWTGQTRSIDEDIALDLANGLKIGTWLIVLLIASYYLILNRKYFNNINFPVLLIVAWLAIIAPIAPNVFKSYLSLLAFASPFAFLVAHASQVGWEKFSHNLSLFLVFYLCGSIATYYLLPDYSRFLVWDGSVGSRLNGFSAHPNGLAALSTLYGIVILQQWCFNKIEFSRLALGVFVCFLIFFLTQSRTSLFAFCVGASCLIVFYKNYGKAFFIAEVFLVILMILVVYLFPSVLQLFTRSGDIAELTTGTGRSYVWSEAFDLIKESPWFGYGYNSTWFLFQDLAVFLRPYVGDYVFPHSHNLYLQILLSGGVVLFLICFYFFASVLVASCRRKNYDVFAFFVCYLSYSMTEAAGFFQYPDSYLIILAVSCAIAANKLIEK